MGASIVYVGLVFLRIVLTFLPEPGYIHPDEFFQSAEIVAGDIFHSNVHVSWEFNISAPIRNIAIPYITCGLPFALLKILSWILGTVNGLCIITTYWLLVAPRIWMTLVSFVMDFLVWKTCHILCKDPYPRLCVFASSYVTLTYYTRPSSNAVESVLCAVLLHYVAKAMIDLSEVTESSKLDKRYSYCPPYKVPIATVLSIGFFNRPTFILFALAPIAFWLQFNDATALSSRIRDIVKRVANLMPIFYIVSACLILSDSIYYSLTVQDITSLNFTKSNLKFICTPCNFITYNTNSTNLESHGRHPRWLHLIVNTPLLFGSLGIAGLFFHWLSFWLQIIKVRKSRLVIKPIEGYLTSSYTLPIVLLSLFSHQEPRFLIPVLFPLVLSHGSYVWGKRWYSLSRITWLLFNAALLFFFGFLHQGGVVPSLQYITTSMSEAKPTHVVYFHTYMPPRHLTTIPAHDKIAVYDLGGGSVAKLEHTISNIVVNHEQHATVLLVSPTTMRSSLENLSSHWKSELIHRFPLHLTTEDLPVVNPKCSSRLLDCLTSISAQFGLDLYSIRKLPSLVS